MRILIAAPPKTGNMWLKCLVGAIYGLRWLKPGETPPEATLAAFAAWAAAGRFRDGTVFHQHYDYSADLAAAIAAVPAHIVTIVRDPYDAFVSTYYTLQQHHAEANRKGRRLVELMGKPLDHPDVVAFLRAGGYRNNLVKARDWMGCADAHVVRYEDLHADPVATLERLTAGIEPVARGTIERAVDVCKADNMRQRSQGMAKHVRAARPGDAEQQLTADHYAAFREAYADLVEELGYPVR